MSDVDDAEIIRRIRATSAYVYTPYAQFGEYFFSFFLSFFFLY
jgi:hypothetical protein